MALPDTVILAKFLVDRLDTNRFEGFRLTGDP